MSIITNVTAREILDSRGNPTVEAEVHTQGGVYTASVPSGMTTGKYEVLELRDGGKRYSGKGVQKVVRNITHLIAPKLVGKNCTRQREIDALLVSLDGTRTKKRLGANALLAVSLACARAGAAEEELELYEHLNRMLTVRRPLALPQPFFNVINGSKHAGNDLSIQEFFISPRGKNFAESLQMGSEVYHTLKRVIGQKYGQTAINVGDEGGFAPPLKKTQEALGLLVKAIHKAGYKKKVDIAVDCAASEFFRNGKYFIDGKKVTKEHLLNYYLNLVKKYNVISIEDPFEQNDFTSFAALREKTKIQVVGDDLTVTNVTRIQKAIDAGSCNCLLLKMNQIGTVSEALQAAELAFDAGWNVMVSHRSGETEDTFIADLAVALGCGQIKAGAPCRGERTVKYNRLLRIEEKIKRRQR